MAQLAAGGGVRVHMKRASLKEVARALRLGGGGFQGLEEARDVLGGLGSEGAGDAAVVALWAVRGVVEDAQLMGLVYKEEVAQGDAAVLEKAYAQAVGPAFARGAAAVASLGEKPEPAQVVAVLAGLLRGADAATQELAEELP